jgi:erythromycin esterase-like protein
MNALPDKLKNLAEFEPPPGGWSTLQRRMHAQRRQRQLFGGFAMAASLLLAVGVGVMLPKTPQEQVAIASSATNTPDDLGKLKQQSRQLENSLDQVRPQVQVWDSRLARRTAGLEKDLTAVDLQINRAKEPESARRLWRNRVALMSQLVQTHQQAALMTVAYEKPEMSL